MRECRHGLFVNAHLRAPGDRMHDGPRWQIAALGQRFHPVHLSDADASTELRQGYFPRQALSVGQLVGIVKDVGH